MVDDLIKYLKFKLPGFGEMDKPRKEAWAARALLAQKWSAVTAYSPEQIDRYLLLLKHELDMAASESREPKGIVVSDG